MTTTKTVVGNLLGGALCVAILLSVIGRDAPWGPWASALCIILFVVLLLGWAGPAYNAEAAEVAAHRREQARIRRRNR